MPKVIINLVGTLRLIFGRPAIEVNTDREMTFRDLLQIASAETGKDFFSYLCDPETEKILPNIVIFVDHENLLHLKGFDTPLADGNQITIMRADMAGG